MKAKRILLALTAAVLVLIGTGCPAGGEYTDVPGEATLPPDASEGTAMLDIDALFAQVITAPDLVPVGIPDEPICDDYSSLGLLRISYTGETGTAYKLQVMHGDDTVYYDLIADGRVEDFSLQFGDGEYTARIMQNIEGDEYFAAETKRFAVALDYPEGVYLNSIQNVDWRYDKLPIEDVRYIVADSLTQPQQELLEGCAKEVFAYVAANVEYDYDKADSLTPGYLPDIVETYIDQSGICYDYASLLASMLRSLGIPAKLVKGYCSDYPGVYHAWNEVYLGGQWYVLDATLGGKPLMGQVELIPLEQSEEKYSKVHEY